MKAPPWKKESPRSMEASSKPPAATTRIADVARPVSQLQQRPTSGPRPMLTVGLRPGSVGNVPVTCRSDGTDVERQLLFSANSHYRPAADIQPNNEAKSAVAADADTQYFQDALA